MNYTTNEEENEGGQRRFVGIRVYLKKKKMAKEKKKKATSFVFGQEKKNVFKRNTIGKKGRVFHELRKRCYMQRFPPSAAQNPFFSSLGYKNAPLTTCFLKAYFCKYFSVKLITLNIFKIKLKKSFKIRLRFLQQHLLEKSSFHVKTLLMSTKYIHKNTNELKSLQKQS